MLVDAITFTITVLNDGPDTATGVAIEDVRYQMDMRIYQQLIIMEPYQEVKLLGLG